MEENSPPGSSSPPLLKSKKTRFRASVYCQKGDEVLLVKLREPQTLQIRAFPPGGQVEQGETPAEAAERELYEETGCRGRVDPDSEYLAQYDFWWGGILYHCNTFFYRASLVAFPEATFRSSDALVVESFWAPLLSLPCLLGHHPVLLESAQKTLQGPGD